MRFQFSYGLFHQSLYKSKVHIVLDKVVNEVNVVIKRRHTKEFDDVIDGCNKLQKRVFGATTFDVCNITCIERQCLQRRRGWSANMCRVGITLDDEVVSGDLNFTQIINVEVFHHHVARERSEDQRRKKKVRSIINL